MRGLFVLRCPGEVSLSSIRIRRRQRIVGTVCGRCVGEIDDVGLVEGSGLEWSGGEVRCKRGSTERDARELVASIQVAGRVILGVVDGDEDDRVDEPYDGAFGSKLHPADKT